MFGGGGAGTIDIIRGTGLETCHVRPLLTVQKCAGTPCCRYLHVQPGREWRQRAFFVGLQRRACKPYENDEHVKSMFGWRSTGSNHSFSDKALSTAGARRRYGVFQRSPLVGLGLRKEPPDSLLLDTARLYRVCFTGIAVF